MRGILKLMDCTGMLVKYTAVRLDEFTWHLNYHLSNTDRKSVTMVEQARQMVGKKIVTA